MTMQPVLGEPVSFSGERVGPCEIGTENGAAHRGQIGRPLTVWSRLDMRRSSDGRFATGEKWPERIVINECDGAVGRDSNVEGYHDPSA